MQEIIQKYIDQNFKLFACNLDKTPVTAHGFHDASCDPEVLKRQFYKQDLFIGFPTGQINGVGIIDIDVNKDGDIRTRDEIMEELKRFGDIPDTFSVITPSGGMHLYFKLRPEDKIPSVRRFFHPTLSVDIRCDGGYVIGADFDKYYPIDQDDITDLRERMAEMPRWIAEFRKASVPSAGTATAQGDAGALLPPEEVREIRTALAYLDADDRDMWIKVGMALKNTHAGSQAEQLHTEWSMTSNKYDPVDQKKKWKSLKPRDDLTIASIFHWAKEKGWVTTYVAQPKVVSATELADKKKTIKKQHERKKFPKELLRPPGFVGELTDFLNSQAIKEQPILNLAAAIGFAGALMGRKFQTESGIRTNIYCVGIGGSGCGKENARESIKKIVSLCTSSGIASICATEELASDTAIYNALSAQPAQIFLIDEVGRMLQTTKSAAKSPYLFGIPSVLLKAYGSSSSLMSGKSYADTKKNVVINNPNLCMYATSTPEQFFDSLSKDNIDEGLVARMLIFESENARPRPKRVLRVQPSQDLIDKVDYLFQCPTNRYSTGNLAGATRNGVVDPLVVPYEHDAYAMIEDYNNYIEDLRDDLEKQGRVETIYNRAGLTAQKLALIIAVGNSFVEKTIPSPVIKVEHVQYAIAVTQNQFENLHFATEHHISSSEHEQNLKKILKIIRDAGHISASDLTRRTQHLKGRDRKEIIDDLKMSEYIEEIYTDTGSGKQTRMFQAL